MKRLLTMVLLFCCCGCGKGDSLQRGSIGGKVTLDGVAITAGTIAFYPRGNNRGPTSGGPIKEGQYSISVDNGPVVGSNRVEIHASKKTGRKVQAPMSEPGVLSDEVIEAVPARYNSASTIMVEIKPGANVFDCELTSLTSR